MCMYVYVCFLCLLTGEKLNGEISEIDKSRLVYEDADP